MASNLRITNSMMNNSSLRYIMQAAVRSEFATYQYATGKRIRRLSDDPVGTLTSMRAKVKLYRMEQHGKNITTAHTWLSQTETSLDETNSMVKKVYEDLVMLSSDTYTSSDREKAAAMVLQFREHMLDIGNAMESERYVFGGFNTTQKPFTVVGGEIHYNGINMAHVNPGDADYAELMAADQNVIEFEIGVGIYSQANIPGTQLMGMGDDNIYKILNDTYNVLSDPNLSHDDISPYLTKMQDAQERILALQAQVGGRMNRLELLEDRYLADVETYKEMRSRVEDIDLGEASLNNAQMKTAYEAALSAAARISDVTLLNYLN